jgi:hypothetical protein
MYTQCLQQAQAHCIHLLNHQPKRQIRHLTQIFTFKRICPATPPPPSCAVSECRNLACYTTCPRLPASTHRACNNRTCPATPPPPSCAWFECRVVPGPLMCTNAADLSAAAPPAQQRQSQKHGCRGCGFAGVVSSQTESQKAPPIRTSARSCSHAGRHCTPWSVHCCPNMALLM